MRKTGKICHRPNGSVEFDRSMNEYYLIRDGTRLIIRYCTWCGGRLQKSRRDLFFTEPSEPEKAEVRELLRNACSHEDVLGILGPADEVSECSGQCATPDHLYFSRWSHAYVFKTRWRTLELWIAAVIEGEFHYWIQGRPLADPRPSVE